MTEQERLQKYESLITVFEKSLEQASKGKGFERHSNGLAFEEQPMQTMSGLLGTHCGLLFQAIKKIQESTRLDKDKAIHELLGAINYIAGAIIFLEKNT